MAEGMETMEKMILTTAVCSSIIMHLHSSRLEVIAIERHVGHVQAALLDAYQCCMIFTLFLEPWKLQDENRDESASLKQLIFLETKTVWPRETQAA